MLFATMRFPNSPAPLLIRADAGGTLGTGHIMRMIALAQAWQDRGSSVTCATCTCSPALIERLLQEGINFVALGDHPPGGRAELVKTIKLGKLIEATWVVIDGYHFGESYQQALQEENFKVLAVDDYGHCKTWHADVVLNQNIGVNSSMGLGEQQQKIPVYLLGVTYTLLRREFLEWGGTVSPKDSTRTNVLITFGGVDPSGATLKILQALEGLPNLPLNVRILAGAANPRVEQIRKRALASPHVVEVIHSTDNMPLLYSWAHRVISAGGSSCYEWMFFRLPGWVTSIAPNQDEIVKFMLMNNLANGLPRLVSADELTVSQSLEKWFQTPSPPQSELVDGFGAQRVAAQLAPVRCWIRPVDAVEDADFLFALANEPTVRSAGRHPDPIPWEDHLAWLQRHCVSHASRLLMIEHLDRGSSGLIRMHDEGDGAWEIGIAIHPEMRNLDLAFSSLSLALRCPSINNQVGRWRARINKTNTASQKLFRKLGFSKTSTESDLEVWVLARQTSLIQ